MKNELLISARKQRGWSQAAAAARLGLTQSQLSRIEAGSDPRPGTARAIKQLYGLTLDQIYDGENGAKPPRKRARK